jgi:hypothetical protein
MRKDRLGRYYDRLRPEERFRLVIEALAREDEEECGRLARSCPKRNYAISDAAYEDRLRASEELTILVCLDLAPRLAKLEMLRAFSEVLAFLRNACLDEAHTAYFRGGVAGRRRAWKAAAREEDPPAVDGNDPETDRALGEITSGIEGEWSKFTDLSERLRQDMLGEAKAIWEAFASFSRAEVGMEAEKLVKAWMEPMLPEIEKLKDISSAPAETEKMEEYESILERIWSYLVT